MPQQVLGGHHQQGLPELPMNLQHNTFFVPLFQARASIECFHFPAAALNMGTLAGYWE